MIFLLASCRNTNEVLETRTNETNITNESSLLKKYNDVAVRGSFYRPFSSGIVHPNPNDAKDRLQSLVGSIIIMVSDTTLDRTVMYEMPYHVLDQNHPPQFRTYDSEIYFDNIIDHKFDSNIEIIHTFANNLGEEGRASTVYECIQKCWAEELDPQKLSVEKIRQYPGNVIEVFVVKSVSLNRLSVKVFNRVHQGAEINGLSFMAGGEIYQSTNQTKNHYEVVLSGFPISMISSEAFNE